MPWVDVEDTGTKPIGRWVDVPEQTMDTLNRSHDLLKHFKRIPEVYQEEIESAKRSMTEGNIVEKALGGLQYVASPINAPLRALVEEPVQSTAEQLGVPRSIAKPLGLAANIGIGFVPIKGSSMLSEIAQASGIGQKYGQALRMPKTTTEAWNEFGDVPRQGISKMEVPESMTSLRQALPERYPSTEGISMKTPTFLKSVEEKVVKVKPTQKDMFGVSGEIPIGGGIPAKEVGEIPLETATKEAAERTFIKKHQLNLPSKPQNIITWIKSKGGIDYQKEFWNGELDIAMQNQPTLKSAINKRSGKGLTLDELSQMAYAEGWIKEADPQTLLNAIEKKKMSPTLIEDRLSRGIMATEGGFLDFEPIYNRIVSKAEGPHFTKSKRSLLRDFAKGADELAGVISTRVGKIAPELKSRLRRYAFDEGINTSRDLQGIQPFFDKFKKLDEPTQFRLTELLSNGKIQDAEEIFQVKGMLSEFRQAEKIKDSVWKRAKESGLEAGHLENYFPRRVRNYEELTKTLGAEMKGQIDKAIAEISQKTGKVLTTEEKGIIADSVLRGYNPGALSLSGPSFAKTRIILELTPELTQHYYPAHETLRQYVESLNRKIAANNFFGKQAMSPGGKALAKMGLTADTDLESSIGLTLERLKERGTKITPEQETELKNILKAVFQPKIEGRGTQAIKSATYATTLTNIGPALTQIQDLSLSMEKEGFFNTISGAIKSITGRQEVTIKDLGIERIAEEMKSAGSPIDWILQQGLKWSGFNAIDKIGKESVINGALLKYRTMANKNPEKLTNLITPIFQDDTAKVIGDDLKSGKITDDVKFLLFNDLSDLQPISKVEVPEKYLTSGKGKIFYALKTYQIKLFDVYRNDIFAQIAKGNVKEGMLRLGRLTAGLVLLGAATDQIKDFVFGRQTDFEDTVVDNFLKIGGFSKYTTWVARKEGLGAATVKTLAPPVSSLNDITKDISKIYGEYISSDPKAYKRAVSKGYETTKDIPLVGKPYYWWFGEGSRKELEKERRQRK